MSEEIHTRFYPTNLIKFSFMSTVTCGCYEIYWFYKSWKYVKNHEKSTIHPFWRALFAPFWTYAISTRIFSGEKKYLSILISFFYFILTAMWKLPDPYWLLSIFSFIAILPLVKKVNDLNIKELPMTYRRFSWQHILTTLIGVPLLLFVFASSLNIIPSTQVIPGNSIHKSDLEFLSDISGLSENEKIIYFYSGGIFSIREDGNYFTNEHVVSYEEDQNSDELILEIAAYSDISDVEISYSKNIFEDTEITIIRYDGSKFKLLVSTEEKKDKIFINTLKSIWSAQQD